MQKYAGRPFALLGISADPDPETQARLQAKHGLTWPSWWDGPHGPIAAVWGVDRFPTFVLVDHEGAIRWRRVGVPSDGEMEKQIDAALARAEKP